MHVRALVCTLALFAVFGCDAGEPAEEQAPAVASPSDPGEGSSSKPSAGQSPRVECSIAENGHEWAVLKPKDNGYHLVRSDGSSAGAIKVEADRIKIKDDSGSTVAKVKTKDNGFKVYDGSDAPVLKAKRKGAGFKLSRPDGQEIGRINVDDVGGVVQGAQITAVSTEAHVEVFRDGQKVAETGASVPIRAAVALGLPGLTLEQRVAVMVHLQERGL